MPRYAVPLLTCVFALVFLGTGVAHAAKLEVDPDAPLWIKLATDALLYAHIGGGAVGLVSGVAAIAARKGQALHRLAGKVFFVSMFVTYLIGAGVAPFLEEGQRPNFVAGILALYLLITALITVRQRGPVRTNWRHYVGLATALGITLMGVVFMYMGANSATGTVDGSPPQCLHPVHCRWQHRRVRRIECDPATSAVLHGAHFPPPLAHVFLDVHRIRLAFPGAAASVSRRLQPDRLAFPAGVCPVDCADCVAGPAEASRREIARCLTAEMFEDVFAMAKGVTG